MNKFIDRLLVALCAVFFASAVVELFLLVINFDRITRGDMIALYCLVGGLVLSLMFASGAWVLKMVLAASQAKLESTGYPEYLIDAEAGTGY